MSAPGLNLAVVSSVTPGALGYFMPDPVLRYIGKDKGFCLDFASSDCFARQAAPLNGDPLVNYSNVDQTRNGAMTVDSGIAFSGGGFDFSACARFGNHVGVANAFEAIQADTNKEWMAIFWIKFPPAANWPATGVSVGLCAANPYSTAADLFTFYLTTSGSNKNIVMRPQTAVGSATALGVANGNTFGGKVCQVFVYRKADGTTTWRVKAADGTATFQDGNTTLATNTANLSGLTWRWGCLTSAQINFPMHDPLTSNDAGVAAHRLYRVMVQSTKDSIQTPPQIADADFTDTVARGVYS